MAKKLDLQERLNMWFLTVSYKDKQETYGTSSTATDTQSPTTIFPFFTFSVP